MSDIFLEALQDYLRGREWRQSIEIFVEANCNTFKKSREFSHQHHGLWKTFQEIVEQIIEIALINVGGSIDIMEDAFDQIASQPSRGPRDDMMKEVISRLKTYHSFEDFACMMKDAANSNNQETDDDQPQRQSNAIQFVDTLQTLGFQDDLIEIVVTNQTEDVTLEKLVMMLSEMQFSPVPTKSLTPSYDVNTLATPFDSVNTLPNKPSANSNGSHLHKFADALRYGDDRSGGVDASDLNAKFVMASSVFESFDSRLDSDESVGQLIHWANSMSDLLSCIKEACSKSIPFDEYVVNGKHLLTWFSELEALRHQIDEESTLGSLISDSELERMAELDRIAASGTEDEQLLHRLIIRHDEVRSETAQYYKRIGDVSRNDGNVDRERLEELYLYLKGQVASGAEIESLADELHERVYSVVPSSRGTEVVNMLLDLHILEDEQNLLRQRINALLQQSPLQAKHQYQNENAIILQEFSGAEPKSLTLAGDTDAFDKLHPTDKADKSNSSQNYSTAVSSSYQDDAKNSERKEDYVDGNKQSSQSPQIARLSINDDGSDYLNELKAKHKAGMEKLRDSLAAEKNRRLQELEDKLARRKLQHKREMANKELTAEEQHALVEEFQATENNVEGEINTLATNFDKFKDGILSGFKKRSVCEMKAVKAAGCRPLTADEANDCYREAADKLKKRHERDQMSLLESLDSERRRQRAKLLNQLEINKSKVCRQDNSAPTPQQSDQLRFLEEQTAEDIQQLEAEFDKQELQALQNSQQDVLLALSAISMDGSLVENSIGANIAEEDEDESYLEDAADANRLRKWIIHVGNMNKSYSAAEAQLMKNINGIAGTAGEMDDEGIREISAHMFKVIADAYSEHVIEFDDSIKLNHGPGKPEDETDRIRAGIMNEFERARIGYDEAIARAKKRSQDKLEQRKLTKPEADSSMSSQIEALFLTKAKRHQGTLENVIDLFLDDPISTKVGNHGTVRKSPLKPIISNRKTSSSSLPTNASVPLSSIEASTVPPEALLNVSHQIDVDASSQDMHSAKDKIRSLHEEKEKYLIDELTTQMNRKKSQLEQRLKQRRHRSEAKYDQGDIESNEEEIVTEANKLDMAFYQLQSLIKTAGSTSSIDNVNLQGLLEILERMMQGEHIESLDDAPKASNDLDTVIRQEEDLPDFESKLDGRNASRREIMDKESLQEKVKKISSEYNEEKQKLDLMMKIQQARQRQILQRKLMERKQQTGFTIPEAAINTKSINSGIASRGLHLGPMMRK